jgi:phosphoribosylformylglycinamidine cyclo-ligase
VPRYELFWSVALSTDSDPSSVSSSDESLTYAASGVDTDAASAGLAHLLSWVGRTQSFREGIGEAMVPNGFFANVLRMSDRLSLAISTDGVGSKSAVAQLVGSYEGIGWDAVAVNVNDVVCAGAEPVAMVDYISLQHPHGDLLGELGKGLHDGAERARVAIVGGELSQHPDTLTGPREGYAFDISGTCVGILDGAAPITGSEVGVGDVVLALPSNGIHANGMTLARMVLLANGQGHDRYLDECGLTVGEELLRPTHIYVPEALAVMRAGVNVHGFAHISGDGLLNLLRLDSEVGYRFDALPNVSPIFDVIQREGGVSDAEMWRVFNMGVGFCVVVSVSDVDRALEAIRGVGGEATVAGEVVPGPKRIELPTMGLIGQDGIFEPTQ